MVLTSAHRTYHHRTSLLLYCFHSFNRSSNTYTVYRSKLLQDRFTTIPATHIKATLDKDGTIFKAFDTLQTQIDNYTALSTKPYTQVHRRRPGIATRKHPSLSNPASMELLGELKEELSAAVMFHSRRRRKFSSIPPRLGQLLTPEKKNGRRRTMRKRQRKPIFEQPRRTTK